MAPLCPSLLLRCPGCLFPTLAGLLPGLQLDAARLPGPLPGPPSAHLWQSVHPVSHLASSICSQLYLHSCPDTAPTPNSSSPRVTWHYFIQVNYLRPFRPCPVPAHAQAAWQCRRTGTAPQSAGRTVRSMSSQHRIQVAGPHAGTCSKVQHTLPTEAVSMQQALHKALCRARLSNFLPMPQGSILMILGHGALLESIGPRPLT